MLWSMIALNNEIPLKTLKHTGKGDFLKVQTLETRACLGVAFHKLSIKQEKWVLFSPEGNKWGYISVIWWARLTQTRSVHICHAQTPGQTVPFNKLESVFPDLYRPLIYMFLYMYGFGLMSEIQICNLI